MKKVLIVLGLLTVLPCMAFDWVELDNNKYVARDTIKVLKNNKRQAWVKSYLDKNDPATRKVFGEQLDRIDFFRTYNTYDCNKKLTKFTYFSYHALDGSILIQGRDNGKFEEVVEGSVGEAEFNYVCNSVGIN